MSRVLTDEEITRQLADLTGWERSGASLVASYTSPDFASAIRLVSDVADVAEQMQHHPDIDIRWTTTHWVLSTHSEGGITQLDVELAHRVAEAARAGRATVEEAS